MALGSGCVGCWPTPFSMRPAPNSIRARAGDWPHPPVFHAIGGEGLSLHGRSELPTLDSAAILITALAAWPRSFSRWQSLRPPSRRTDARKRRPALGPARTLGEHVRECGSVPRQAKGAKIPDLADPDLVNPDLGEGAGVQLAGSRFAGGPHLRGRRGTPHRPSI